MLTTAIAAIATAAIIMTAAPRPVLAASVNPLKKMNAATLLGMVKGGMFGYIDRSGGGREIARAALLVNASPQKVWATLIGYENYMKLIPLISSSKVLERKTDGAKVALTVSVLRVGPINISSQGTSNMKFVGKDHIDILPADGKDKTTWGAWDLVPAEGGKKTILIYSYTSDVAGMGGTTKALIQKEPTLNISINMANVMVMLEGMKIGAEK
jgi:ribosome-associated toxin RatA of RatAB toxin-antitoxin module